MNVKAYSLPLAVLLLPSCALLDSGDEDVGPPGQGDPDQPAGDGVEESFMFDTSVARLAADTELAIVYATGAEFRLVSTDPSVLEAERDGDQIRLLARSPGRASLMARSADDERELAVLPLEVVAADAIEFRFRTRPVVDGSVERLAALRDTTDSIKIVYLDADGEVLAGVGPFSATGDSVEVGDATTVESRISEAFEPGFSAPLRFGAPGQGAVSAELPGGLAASIPIDVVAAPAQVDLVTMVLRDGALVSADQVDVDEPVGVDVVGRTDDGRFVAGVSASWAAGAPIDVWFRSAPSSEIVVSLDSAATARVTATVEGAGGALVATRRLTAE